MIRSPEDWQSTRIDRVMRPVKQQVRMQNLAGAAVFHYSIPNVQEFGDGAEEDKSGIQSDKLLISQPCLLVSRLNPRKATIVIARPRSIPTVCSTEFVPLAPRAIDLDFAMYLFRSEAVRQSLSSAVRSATRSHQRAEVEDITKMQVALPPPSEQRAIADFLDRETARIDALVAKQEEFLGLLSEHRRALVADLMAHGTRGARLMATDTEVFPHIPEAWTIQRLKHLVRPGTSISYGIVQPGPHLPGGVAFVQTADLTKRRFSVEDLQRTAPEIAATYPRSRIRAGDVMLGIRASVGDAALVPEHLDGANLSRGIARIVPGRGITGSYLVHALSTPQVAWFWSLNMQGSTFREVSIETVRELPLPVPPLDEQAEIVAQFEVRLGKHDALRARATEMIERLREHRAALITAAVTGGIAAAKPLADRGPSHVAAA